MNASAPSSTSTAELRTAQAGAYKDIAVHLDGSPEDEVRIAHAEALAARWDARLTGLFTNPLPDPALYANEFGASAIGQMTDYATREGDAVMQRLGQRFARLGALHELRRIETFPGLLEQSVATEARWNDLFIATSPREGEHARWRSMIEAVMFDSGRGLLLLPPQAEFRSAIRTVLVGWVDSRQSARAVAEALPLLAQASRVRVVTVREEAHGRMGGAEVLADITAHLARHGVETTAEVLSAEGCPADSLLAEARRTSADLIVAGAYGHSRFREWILGGVTEELLRAAPVPLLVAH